MEDEQLNILYLKWLNDEITSDEFKLLEASSDFDIAKSIISEVDTWETRSPSLDYDSLKKHEEKKVKKRTKIRKLKTTIAIAASLLVLVSVEYLGDIFSSEQTFSCESSEIKKITLPDGTKVILNSNSTLTYDANNWTANREVFLSGQANFNVMKKGSFVVNFKEGFAKVLGTEFDVLSSDKFQVIKCYEGTVGVSMHAKIDTLLQGEQFVNGIKRNNSKHNTPEWTGIYTKFDNADLLEVITILELKFDLQIDHSSVNTQRKFTGQFSNTDVNLALQMAFKPFGIKYTLDNHKVTLN